MNFKIKRIKGYDSGANGYIKYHNVKSITFDFKNDELKIWHKGTGLNSVALSSMESIKAIVGVMNLTIIFKDQKTLKTWKLDNVEKLNLMIKKMI